MNRQRKIKILVFVICLALLFGFYKFIAQPKLKSIPLNKFEEYSSDNDNLKIDADPTQNNNKTVVKRNIISEQDSVESIEPEHSTTVEQESDLLVFPVHIMGAVKRPGVYQANGGMIIQDVIELSGGLNPDADLLLINLAEPVQANTKIYIPNTEEIEQDLFRYEMAFTSKTESIDVKSAEEKSDKVNLNTADFDLLQTLTE